MVIRKIKTAYRTAKDFGFKWTFRRLYYEWQLRSGYHKRHLPSRPWKKNELKEQLQKTYAPENILETWKKSDPKFLFQPEDQAEISASIKPLYQGHPNLLSSLENIDIHRPRYFTKLNYEVEFPDIWFTNPFLNPPVSCKRDLHWSDYPMYSKNYEDLKFIWEYGRFSIVYDMVRSYFLTKDQSLAEQFWTLVESWIDNNPPNTGPHWKCGQETSLRLMAWYFGLFAFKDSPATTPKRFEKFLYAVAIQADRISKDLNYSYLQHSNHAVSEGLGLYATALLFPQLKLAKEWKERGKKILEERVSFLIRKDGTYFQKSHNYLRFVLHGYLFVLALGEANDEQFSDALKERLSRALDYLKSVFDSKSGKVPNYGSNDGALVLPLNSCDFTDYRGVIGALHFYLYKERCFENGPWNEDLVWLFGSQSVEENAFPQGHLKNEDSRKFSNNGLYVLRTPLSAAFIHAESFKDRPAHADSLHLDLWWKGLNICIDPGTYLYYGHQPWFDAFRHTKVHNTVCVDDQDQMDRLYRFTWGNWHSCQLNNWNSNKKCPSLEVEHHGYQRLKDPVVHRRAVVCVEQEYWLVIDDLVGKARHDLTLHWLINDFPFIQKGEKIDLKTSEGDYSISINNYEAAEQSPLEIIKGNPQKGIFGLRSNYYGILDMALSVKLKYTGSLPARFISCFGPKGWELQTERKQKLSLTTNKHIFELDLKPKGQSHIIENITTRISEKNFSKP